MSLKRMRYCVVPVALLLVMVIAGCGSEYNEHIPNNPADSGYGEATLVLSSEIFMTGFDSSLMTYANGEPEKETTSFNVDDNQGVIIDSDKGGAGQLSPQTRAINIATGVHYRLVIYKAGETAIYSQFEFASGTGTPIGGGKIALPTGSYEIYAYSFNKTDAIPELSNDNDIAVNDGDDFMCIDKADLTVTIEQMGTTIDFSPLTFQRKCCNIWVKVESIDFDDTAITDCNITLGDLPASATWNLKSSRGFSNVSGNATVAVIANGSSAKNTPISGSINCIPAGSRQLTLSTATFSTGSGGKTKFSFNGKPVPDITYASGNQYLISIRGVRAYVPTTPGPVTIGGVKWSAYNSTTGKKFMSNPWEKGYYFSFNDAKSACPSGYHTPSQTELSKLPGKAIPKNSYVWINNASYQITNDYGFFSAPSISSAILKDGDNILCLPAQGRKYNGSGSAGEFRVNVNGFYWSNVASGGNGYDIRFSNTDFAVKSDGQQVGQAVRCVAN